MALFYVIGTPIGNLEDITLRALRILKEVDIILCEDTRVTKRLLEKYEINTPMLSYHDDSTSSKVESIITMLEEGKNMALVSDAGTPGISDPGAMLVQTLRAHFDASALSISAIPGPSALTALFSIAGVPCHEFTFLGFLPHKKGRETLFKEMAASDRTVIFYESPHRILKALSSLEQFAPQKKITVGRELTKIYEEIYAGTGKEVKDYFEANQDKIRGEFVVIVSE